MNDDMMKYMDNPLRSPLCLFVMELIYNLGDISHSVESAAPIIRSAVIVVLKEYIKILKEEDDEYDIDHHSFYIILPIIWGILNTIKEDVYASINIDYKIGDNLRHL